jgi:hypothetical protein
MSQAQPPPGDNLEAGVVEEMNGNTGAVRAPCFFLSLRSLNEVVQRTRVTLQLNPRKMTVKRSASPTF